MLTQPENCNPELKILKRNDQLFSHVQFSFTFLSPWRIPLLLRSLHHIKNHPVILIYKSFMLGIWYIYLKMTNPEDDGLNVELSANSCKYMSQDNMYHGLFKTSCWIRTCTAQWLLQFIPTVSSKGDYLEILMHNTAMRFQ